MTSYELHPLCVLFPRMGGAELATLTDDIKVHGLRSPIVLHDGMILDGGNRYRACMDAGVEPKFENFANGNPVSFVLSANLHRRHMSAGQQAAIVATATDWAKAHKHGGDRHADQETLVSLGTVEKRAAMSGAGTTVQKQADKLARKHPEKAREVAQGKKSLYRAVKETAPPPKPPTKPVKKPAVKTAKQIADDKVADDAHAGFDPLVELTLAQREIETLQALLDAVQADDPKAEVLKWRRAHQVAEKRQGEIMEAANQAAKHTKFLANQLQRCGRAVGETDPDKIAPTVEAFVRAHSKQAA